MIGNDFETPIMYQDIANYNMGPMAMPVGFVNPYAGYNLLGGTKMTRQLDSDKVEIMETKNKEDKGTFKKALTALGVILALGSIPIFRKNIKKAGGVGKYLKNKWTSLVNFVKGNNVKTPKSKKFRNWCSAKWKGFKNLFKRNKTKTPKSKKFRNWCSAKWKGFKNLFKRKNKNNPPPPTPIITIT